MAHYFRTTHLLFVLINIIALHTILHKVPPGLQVGACDISTEPLDLKIYSLKAQYLG